MITAEQQGCCHNVSCVTFQMNACVSMFSGCTAARHKALKSLNMPVEQFQAQGTLMALSDLSLQYKAPLRAGDTFYVTTAIAQVNLGLT